MSIKNPRKTLQQRRELRKQMTNAEELLWQNIRAKRAFEVRVKRQYGIGPYILDFYIPRINLAIEVDGEIHLTPEVRKKDLNRDVFLNENGIDVIRFKNEEILNDLENVLLKLKQIVNSYLKTH